MPTIWRLLMQNYLRGSIKLVVLIRDLARLATALLVLKASVVPQKLRYSDAINGMQMILEDDAADGWRRVKLKVACCVNHFLLQNHRGIFMLRFLKPNNRTRRRTFSSGKNAQVMCEPKLTKLIFTYMQIRDRGNRNKILDLDEMLSEAREAELFWQECKQHDTNSGDHPSTTSAVRCGFPRKKGHTMNGCFKRKNEEAKEKYAANMAQVVILKPKYACYACNDPGVTRNNCPNCRKIPTSFNSPSTRIGREIHDEMNIINGHIERYL